MYVIELRVLKFNKIDHFSTFCVLICIPNFMTYNCVIDRFLKYTILFKIR